MLSTVRLHWPEYLIEAAGLGLFMIAAAVFGVLLEHPDSAVRQLIASGFVRRGLMGVAMGFTAVGIVYSRWGRQSGAHLNPAVTLAFFRLGKVRGPDAVFYGVAQFLGGAVGLGAAALALGPWLGHPAVRYVVTVPGPAGAWAAGAAELGIAFGLMGAVLLASNSTRFARLTGLFAGALVALYITVEAPISGMSMNPARTLASALPAREWTALWVYFVGPPLGMLLAAEAYRRLCGLQAVRCAKLDHGGARRCIFRCGYAPQGAADRAHPARARAAMTPGMTAASIDRSIDVSARVLGFEPTPDVAVTAPQVVAP
ncbi:MAG: aquaporin [Candidatus Rokuibacteriota bacterium]